MIRCLIVPFRQTTGRFLRGVIAPWHAMQVSSLTGATAGEVTSTDGIQQLDAPGVASRLRGTILENVTNFTCPSVARLWHAPQHLVADD